MRIIKVTFLWSILVFYHVERSLGLDFSPAKIRFYREKVRSMFYHAYNGYLDNAFPLDELKPLSCTGMDTWGSFSLTLIDALDTLLIMGNETEFIRAVNVVLKSINVEANVNVSVFETNIRVVGGLLSAHMFSGRVKGMQQEPGWPCSGALLRLAERVAQRLLPAFNTETGLPYGTVNLKWGVHSEETPITCTAGAGTFILEFATLSKLTGNFIYERIAWRALEYLWKSRSPIGLLGNHINVQTGAWTATDAGIGAGVDSYFEYLVKGALLLQRPLLMQQFNEYLPAINKWVRKEDWFMWVSMTKGTVSIPIFQSLEAFWPGLLVLTGDVEDATRIMLTYQQIIKQYGFPPEFYNIPNQEAVSKRSGYPLRPEMIESLMYLYRATEDPNFLQLGVEILEAIEFSCKTRCGYATVKNVLDHRIEDRMESFFLAETTKYLYLLFDPENFIHNDGTSARVIETTNGQCVIDAGGYIFNTEAHPLDPGILYCCSAKRQRDVEMIRKFEEDIDFISLMGLNEKNEANPTVLQEEDLSPETKELGKAQTQPTAYFERQYGNEEMLEFEIERPKTRGDDFEEFDGNAKGEEVTNSIGSSAGQSENTKTDSPPRSTSSVMVEAQEENPTPTSAVHSSNEEERTIETTESPTAPIVQPSLAQEQKDLSDEISALLAKAREIDANRTKTPGMDLNATTEALMETMKTLLGDWKGLLESTKKLEKDGERLRRKAKRKRAKEEPVAVAECQNCCRLLDRIGDSISLRKMLNAVYSKHIYPRLKIPFVLGPVCRDSEQPSIAEQYNSNAPEPFELDMDKDGTNEDGEDGVDQLSFGSFRYRQLASKQFQLLTAPGLPFRARFSVLGQVMPRKLID